MTPPRARSLLPAVCVLVLGCGPGDPADARDRLAALLGPLPAGVEVLAGEQDAAAGESSGPLGETWAVLSADELPAPDDAAAGPAPAAAVLTAAAAMGVGPDRAGEPDPAAAGVLREWDGSGGTIRVRSVRTGRGVLSVVEFLPP